MGAYATVNWQPDDEVTSQKLQQMAQNEEYLKENLIIGNNNYQVSTLGVAPAGREPGIVSATKVEGIRVDFDSQVPVAFYIARVQLPPVFTQPPIIALGFNTQFAFGTCNLGTADRTDFCELVFTQRDGLIERLYGQIHLICIGK